MHCAFVYFKQAFDLVYRNGNWYKLLVSKVSSKLVNMMQVIHNAVITYA